MTTIGSTQLYDRTAARLGALNDKADELQQQISTNKKLTVASQDVAGWQRLQRINQASADDTAYKGNIAIAANTLAQTDTALGTVVSRIQRAQELAIQANSGTLSDANRASIATELDAIVEDLNSLSVAKDGRGTPLFGTAPVAIPIGDGQSVQPTETLDRAFGTGANNLMTIISTLSTALKAGGSPTAAAGAAIGSLNDAVSSVGSVRAAVGARAARVDLVSDRLTANAADRDIERGSIEDTDITATITELQKTMTVLQATQASFTKLSALSLFDYLR